MKNVLITQNRPGGERRVENQRYPGIMLREKLRSWQTTALQSFREELADFIALVRGTPGTRIADGLAGLRAAQVAEAVRKSTQTGEAIHLPALPGGR
jgi:predicted dehydrogenase